MGGRSNWRKTAQASRPSWVFWVIFLPSLGLAGLVVLPLFLNQSNKCCGLDTLNARRVVGTLLRSQQVFFLYNRRFANSLDEIMQSSNIQIDHRSKQFHDFTIETTSDRSIVRASPKKPAVRSYIGAVFRLDKPAKDTGAETAAIVCEAKVPDQRFIQPPLDARTCGFDSTKWNP